MSNKIQMPRDWYFHVKKFHMAFAHYMQFGDEDTLAMLGDLHARISKGIREKQEAEDKRRLYSEYKTATEADIREDSRQAYLDAVGMHKDFRFPAGYDLS
jgi:phosphosulfolactate phosphohydrolase-like enzyme